MLVNLTLGIPEFEKRFREIQDLYRRLREAILDLNACMGMEAELTGGGGNDAAKPEA